MVASCRVAGLAWPIAETMSHLCGVNRSASDWELLGDAVGFLQVDLAVLPSSGAPAGGVEQRQGKPAIAGAPGGVGAALSTLQATAGAHVGDGAVIGFVMLAVLLVVVAFAVVLFCYQMAEEPDPEKPFLLGGSGRPSLSGSVKDDDAVSTSVGPFSRSSRASSRASSSIVSFDVRSGSERRGGRPDRALEWSVGPLPISPPSLMKRNCEERLFIGMDSLLNIKERGSLEKLDLVGLSGRILIQVEVKKQKDKGRCLKIMLPGSAHPQPLMRIFATPGKPIKIYRKDTESLYGTLETDQRDRNQTKLMRNNQPTMLLEKGKLDEFRIDASCMDGPTTKVKLASAARSEGPRSASYAHSEAGEWNITVEPNVDAFLLAGTMLAVLLLQPAGPPMRVPGSYAHPGGHGFAPAGTASPAADAPPSAVRLGPDGRASMDGRLSTGGGMMFMPPAPAMMQAHGGAYYAEPAGIAGMGNITPPPPPRSAPLIAGRLSTDERPSVGVRFSTGPGSAPRLSPPSLYDRPIP